MHSWWWAGHIQVTFQSFSGILPFQQSLTYALLWPLPHVAQSLPFSLSVITQVTEPLTAWMLAVLFLQILHLSHSSSTCLLAVGHSLSFQMTRWLGSFCRIPVTDKRLSLEINHVYTSVNQHRQHSHSRYKSTSILKLESKLWQNSSFSSLCSGFVIV